MQLGSVISEAKRKKKRDEKQNCCGNIGNFCNFDYLSCLEFGLQAISLGKVNFYH
jgi:hypothetical protein